MVQEWWRTVLDCGRSLGHQSRVLSQWVRGWAIVWEAEPIGNGNSLELMAEYSNYACRHRSLIFEKHFWNLFEPYRYGPKPYTMVASRAVDLGCLGPLQPHLNGGLTEEASGLYYYVLGWLCICVVFDVLCICYHYGHITDVLHYECFTTCYFFGVFFVDSPQILLRFWIICLVSFTEPGSGLVSPISLKSFGFLFLLRSSLMDFLKGGFFSLICIF